MNIFSKIWCRLFQGVFKIVVPMLPYREPKVIESVLDIKNVLKEKNISSVLLVTDGGVKNLTKDLVKEGFVIVSGLAKGIDAIAHQTVLTNDGKTIAVLGNGIKVNYPLENSLLQNELSTKGLIVSEYPDFIEGKFKKDTEIGFIKIYCKNNLIFIEKIYTIL